MLSSVKAGSATLLITVKILDAFPLGLEEYVSSLSIVI